MIGQRIAHRIGTAPSSSMGRLFDAVASLLGVRHVSAYEAQAAMELEALARRAGPVAPASACAFTLGSRDGLVQLESAPVLRHLVEGLRAGVARHDLAAHFHEAVARAVLALAQRLRGETSIPVVGLSGGVFQNVTLLERTGGLLEDDGFRVLTHRLVPPNDGGLSLGQAVAAATPSSPWQTRAG